MLYVSIIFKFSSERLQTAFHSRSYSLINPRCSNRLFSAESLLQCSCWSAIRHKHTAASEPQVKPLKHSRSRSISPSPEAPEKHSLMDVCRITSRCYTSYPDHSSRSKPNRIFSFRDENYSLTIFCFIFSLIPCILWF